MVGAGALGVVGEGMGGKKSREGERAWVYGVMA